MADNYSSINEASGPSNRSASVMNWITVDQGRICYRWILDSELISIYIGTGSSPHVQCWVNILWRIRGYEFLTKRLRLTPHETWMGQLFSKRIRFADISPDDNIIVSVLTLAICHQRSTAHAFLFSCCHQRYRAIWSREEHGEHQSW